MTLERQMPRVWSRRLRASAFALAFIVAGWVVVLAEGPEESTASADSTAAPATTPAPAATTPPAAAAKPREEPGPDLTPYAVLIRLNAPAGAQLDHRLRDDLLSKIATGVRAGMGQMWETTIDFADDSQAATPAALEQISGDDLTDRFADAGFDKVYLVGVSQAGSTWSLAVREWDEASRTTGPVHESSTSDVRLLAPLATDLLMEAFRPVARIEAVEEGVVTMKVRAGEFPPADPLAVPFETGDLLTPFVRYYDRDRNLQQIRDLPWTYLRVSTVERARMECETLSAYRTPLSGSRRRMELMGIAARPTFASTRLIIAPRGDATNPLPGCRVELLDRLPTAEDPVNDRQKLLTDRLGSIVVNVDPEHPLRHVLVHSGKAVLGRVPFMPGLTETALLSVPDDAPRLSVEGALSVLEGELIDAVSRRSVLIARSRRSAKARKWDEVDRFLEQLQTVPDYEAFRQRVAAIQLPAAQSAKTLGDRVAESRINKMCSDVQQAAANHLDAEKIREFRTEMSELKAAAK